MWQGVRLACNIPRPLVAAGNVNQVGALSINGPSTTAPSLYIEPQSAVYTGSLLKMDTTMAGSSTFKYVVFTSCQARDAESWVSPTLDCVHCFLMQPH